MMIDVFGDVRCFPIFYDMLGYLPIKNNVYQAPVGIYMYTALTHLHVVLAPQYGVAKNMPWTPSAAINHFLNVLCL